MGLWPVEELRWSELDKEARVFLCMEAGLDPRYAVCASLDDLPDDIRSFLEMQVDLLLRGEFKLVP